MRVYVAGPYSADNVMSVLRNMGRGIRETERLFAAGHDPFCPWVDYHYEFVGDHDKRRYYEYSLAWLEVSEAVVLVGDWRTSAGTLKEIARAVELGIPVFESVDAFLAGKRPMPTDDLAYTVAQGVVND
jgi:hypothetical protein